MNEPVFPTYTDDAAQFRTFEGMSLRDYFAAAALTGFIQDGMARDYDQNARHAYRTADAMLAERDRKEKE